MLKDKRILMVHSNTGDTVLGWQRRRLDAARSLGYRMEMLSMAELHPYTIFPRLDRLWKLRDPALMRLYEKLGTAIADCDLFIHYNGALIHPEFLAQFSQPTVYHCADDPDASAVLSRPVATSYDVCAISNPACISMYRSWGCREVFFWPLGSFSYDERTAPPDVPRHAARGTGASFVGSRNGVPRFRFIGGLLGLYRKKGFMDRVEREIPGLRAYGAGWRGGRIEADAIPALYRDTRVGFNVHNSLGPINARLYDLSAFGVCQVCDNKSTLGLVFQEGSEIIGFDTVDECVALMRGIMSRPEKSEQIGFAARDRFLRDYTTAAIWRNFFANLEPALARAGRA